jgi:hypothetical protein
MIPNKTDTNFIISKHIREYTDKWDWKKLSSNKAITMDIIEENADIPWSKRLVVLNPNLTWDFIIKHIEYYKNDLWTWEFISAHKCVTMETVKSHPDLPWNYKYLSQNLSITIDCVLERINLPWDWYALSRHPNMTWDIVQTNNELPWSKIALSANPNITLDIIKDNFHVDWYYEHFIMNVNLTYDIVKNNPGLPFNAYRILNTHYLQSCPWYINVTDLTWDTSNYKMCKSLYLRFCIFLNPNTTWDIVINNPNKPWDYSELSMNQNITWDIVKASQDKSWNYSLLSLNQNITWDIVIDNPNTKWNWVNLSSNPSIFKLTDQDVKFISTVRYIQDMWRNALYNPKYTICRKRIMREFNELGDI